MRTSKTKDKRVKRDLMGENERERAHEYLKVECSSYYVYNYDSQWDYERIFHLTFLQDAARHKRP